MLVFEEAVSTMQVLWSSQLSCTHPSPQVCPVYSHFLELEIWELIGFALVIDLCCHLRG